MRTVALALLSLLAGCAATPGEDWSPADTRRQLAATALIVVDGLQTAEFAGDPRWSEGNPVARAIVGADPSAEAALAGAAAWALTNYVVARRLTPEWRRRLQWLTIGGHGLAVLYNCANTDVC